MMLFTAATIRTTTDPRLLREIYLKTVSLVLLGYTITQVYTAIAIGLRLTDMTYRDMIIPAGGAIIGTIVSAIAIYMKRTPSYTFGTMMYLLQYPLFLSMYTMWVFRLQELRSFGLFCALIAIVFIMYFANSWQSLSISLGTIVAQIAVSYYAIYHAGQGGSFLQELFYSLSLLPSFLFLALVSRYIQKNIEELQMAKKNSEIMNMKLRIANKELHRSQELSKVDMELASSIQRNLMPDEPPRTSGWDVAFSYKPRYNVSGDFYDFYYENDELKGIALFDVSGHGVSAGLITMIAKPMLFRIFKKWAKEPLSRMIESADSELSREIQGTQSFATGIVLRFSDGTVEYVNAGHPDILMKSAVSREVLAIGSDDPDFRGKPLGMEGLSTPFTTITIPIRKGDLLLLFTDCLVESSDSQKTPYGMARLMGSLRDAPEGSAQEVLTHIINGFSSHTAGGTINDDFTVILARRIH
ncbi:MAG: serine/threonine-protein phosphatase [Spirochaetes bacterium]|nr:serine/threonine-protein phosphatase [Spirochaetota bacterium]